jgi:predicted phosphoribosyltransferase
MIFRDRIEAAERLSDALAAYRGANALVLAIPRGAVPMGRAIARRLDGEFDVVLVRKLRAPFSPEFAVGAIDETGWTYIAPHARQAGADERYLAEEKAAQLATLHRRRAEYTPHRPPIDPAGRVAIVVDDGLATGATMIAAARWARTAGARRVVAAVPAGAAQTVALLRAEVDDIECLRSSDAFGAVGFWYADFGQVGDREVIALLEDAAARHPAVGEAA